MPTLIVHKKTTGGVLGAASRGVGSTVNNTTGKAGEPIGQSLIRSAFALYRLRFATPSALEEVDSEQNPPL